MKFASFVLFLACSALISTLAVQSLPRLEPSIRHRLPRAPFSLERLLFPHRAEREPAARYGPVAAAVPLLSKAETLSLIAEAATKYRVPAAFVTSIVAAESNFNSAAISDKGAIGLMQLMPETAQQFGADPTVPAENVDAGTHYLRKLMDRYQNHRSSIQRVIAAFNAGPGAVDHYRGIPPFRETRVYVAQVLSFIKRYSTSRKHGSNKG